MSIRDTKKLRKAQHLRLEEIARALNFDRAKSIFHKLGYARADMHYRAEKGEREYSTEFMNKLKNAYPQVNLEYFMNGIGEPIITSDAVKSHGLERLVNDPTGFMKTYTVKDNLMGPDFKKGDVLVCRPIDAAEVVEFGEVFLLLIGDINYVRFVWPDADAGFILKTSVPGIEDKKIPKTEIQAMWKIIRMARDLE